VEQYGMKYKRRGTPYKWTSAKLGCPPPIRYLGMGFPSGGSITKMVIQALNLSY